MDTSKITRMTVVDWRSGGDGRVIEEWDISVELSVQDDGKTLKVFMKDRV